MAVAPSPATPADRAADNEPVALALTGVRFAWSGARPFAIGIDAFAVAAGERVLLMGPSGGGKSTLLGLIAGILTPASGQIRIAGTDLTTLSAARRDRFRAEQIGVIFQLFNLLPYGSIIDNVLLPLRFAPERAARAAAERPARAEAERLLAALGLDLSDLQPARAADLSVGQQQRVAAARALIGRPKLILADEPTSALDKDRRGLFLNLLMAECAAAGTSLLMVSHDQDLAPLFDRAVGLDDVARISRGAVS